MSTYVFDIDGVIADLTHRMHFVTNQSKDDWPEYERPTMKDNPDWDGFHANVADDAPIVPIIRIIRLLDATWHDIFFLTARPSSCRDATIAWFNKHEIPCLYPDIKLITRPDGDRLARTTLEWKREALLLIDKHWFPIIAYFDDSKDNVSAAAEAGIPSFLLKMRGHVG